MIRENALGSVSRRARRYHEDRRSPNRRGPREANSSRPASGHWPVITPAKLGNPALAATVWGELADPDADGSVNLIEHAFGTDPHVNSSVVRPVSGIDPEGHLIQKPHP